MSVDNRHLDVTALGTTVRLEFAHDVSDDFEQQVRRAWSSAIAPDAEPDRSIVISDVTDEPRRLELLSMQTTLEALDHQRGKLVMFHAAGVALEDGRVVAFVGPSGRGKTTLSRALGTKYGYVSDETIAVDAALRVYPYRKPLSVVQPDAPKLQVSPAEAGLLDLPEGELRLASLVLLERDPSVTQPVIEPVPFVTAIEQLVPQLSYLPDVPQPLQRLATLSDSVGGVMRVRYAEATEVVGCLPDLVRYEPLSAAWEPAIEAVDGDYQIGDVDDAVRIGRHVVVLGGGQVQTLDGIAPTIWEAVRRGHDRAGIIDCVVAEYGRPEHAEAEALVDDALAMLVQASIVAPTHALG